MRQKKMVFFFDDQRHDRELTSTKMAKQRQADEALDTLILRPEHVEQTGDRLSFRVPPGNTPLLCFVNPRSGGAQVPPRRN